jgi:hypothetical protein
MMLHLILGFDALLAAAFIACLVLAIVGIHRGDRGKRLTGRPAGPIEAFTRRLLTGSRGFDDPSDFREGR